MSIDWCDSPVQIADASQVTLENNIFDSTKIKNLDTAHSLLITKNWWGSESPDFSNTTGTVSGKPWCLTASCSSYYTDPTPPSSGGGSIVIPSLQYFLNGNIGTGTSTTSTTTLPTTNIGNAGQVLGASTYSFKRNMGYGVRGDDVTELQKILMKAGYLKLRSGVPTKYFGPLTHAVLIKWQLANKIAPANGYFGDISRTFLNK